MADQNPAVSDPNPDNVEDANTTLLTVAPVVPVVPAAAAPVVEAATSYEPTGDVGLDMALDFIGKAGIAPDHPAMKAAEQGDFSILKAALAAKGTQGWEQFVALGEDAYARNTKAAEAKADIVRQAVYQEAGGKEAWANIQKWASDNATPDEKTTINGLLNQGGLAAKSAVKYLTDAYAKANNVVVNPAEALTNAGRNTQPSGDNAPLDPRGYANAVQALNNKLNGRLEGSKEYETLQKRRAAFRG